MSDTFKPSNSRLVEVTGPMPDFDHLTDATDFEVQRCLAECASAPRIGEEKPNE